MYDKIRDKFRNNKKTYNKQNNSRKFLKHPDKKRKNLGEHLQIAYLTLVKKDKGNHDGETNFSEDPDMVVALAMQNYQKAHKLKFKANKRQIKMLRQLDADKDKAENDKGKNVTSGNKNSKSNNKSNNRGKKQQCSKCKKWGSHTAEECTSDNKSITSEEANVAEIGNAGSHGRTVQKISKQDYNMDSDEEEGTLYLHQENRIKAQEVTADEYAYYANYGEAAKESELGWSSGKALGRVRGYDSDTMSETNGCETACFAHKGDSRGDGSENDDDDSVITDDGEEDVEVTAVDDQQRPRTPARDITRLTSY